MHSIQANIDAIRTAMASACKMSNRAENSVHLIAVSKTRSAAEIRQVATSGVHHMGENYLQEAIPKIAELTEYDLTWHFIGAIQSNKTHDIATHFDWVHTVDRLKIARRLNQHCIDANRSLNICIQVNIDNEPQKAGIAPEKLPALIEEITSMKALSLRGLMAIPKVSAETPGGLKSETQKFVRLVKLFEQQLKRKTLLPAWDTLSMGMTADYVAAIHAGTTFIRVGTAIFGPRVGKSSTTGTINKQQEAQKP